MFARNRFRNVWNTLHDFIIIESTLLFVRLSVMGHYLLENGSVDQQANVSYVAGFKNDL
jgi:hypothetical protein